MSTSSLGSMQSAQGSSFGSTLRGILVGLVPLVLLALSIVLELLLTAFARQWFAASGFFVRQQVALIVLISGFVLAVVIYALAIVLTLRRMKGWQEDGAVMWARSALWTLGITALIVVVPLLLAVLLPQHPAP